MGKTKYKSMLAKKVNEDRTFQTTQDHLKKKHNIKGKNVVVVEKSNTFKFTLKMLAGIVRLLFTVILLTFAVIGIIAIIYPDPRMILLEIGRDVLIQLRDFIT